MYLKTPTGMYVHAIHGTAFITWVAEKNQSNALSFPEEQIDVWIEIILDMTGMKVEAIYSNIEEPVSLKPPSTKELYKVMRTRTNKAHLNFKALIISESDANKLEDIFIEENQSSFLPLSGKVALRNTEYVKSVLKKENIEFEIIGGDPD